MFGAIAVGAALLAESQLGWKAVPSFALHDGPAVRGFGGALLAFGVLGAAALPRVLALGTHRTLVATAVAAGFVFAATFHAIARDLPTLRPEGGIVARVPGARLVAFGFRPGLFYYAEPAATVYVAGVRGLVDPFVAGGHASRLELSREQALAMLREDTPTFAWIDQWEVDDLAALADTRELRRDRKFALVANPAARRALVAQGVASGADPGSGGGD